MTADQRLIGLRSLHKRIGGELKALVEQETATGPVRNLALLLKGDNSQKLNLGTSPSAPCSTGFSPQEA